jgi:hypothetical protein
MATGANPAALPNTKDDVRWPCGISCYAGNVIGVTRKPDCGQKLAAYVKNLKGKTVDISEDALDPSPLWGTPPSCHATRTVL